MRPVKPYKGHDAATFVGLDMPNTDSVAAVVIIGSKPGESDRLLPRDPADLRQTHQDGHGFAICRPLVLRRPFASRLGLSAGRI